MAQRDPKVLSRAPFVAIRPEGRSDLRPLSLADQDQMQAQFADPGPLPGWVIDDLVVAPNGPDAKEGDGGGGRCGHTPAGGEVRPMAGLCPAPARERKPAGRPRGDRTIESGHVCAGARQRIVRRDGLEECASPEGGPDRPLPDGGGFEQRPGRLGIVQAQESLGHGDQGGGLGRQDRAAAPDLFEQCPCPCLLPGGGEQASEPGLRQLEASR